eukprot:Phypoly_transcript_00976.p1 GENE.Phypoly_transcript_00976~~Phypoly_transcript_00976.p1  ORF type:complete len:1215 (+),score=300.28 Phypoly_transcript_00976:74-3646(+)
MTKRKTQGDSIQPAATKRSKKDKEEYEEEGDGEDEVTEVVASPARSRRQQRQIIYKEDSSDFEEDNKKKPKKKSKKQEPKARQQIGSFFNKTGDKKDEAPKEESSSSNPPSPQKSPKKTPKTRGRKKNTTKTPPATSKSPPASKPPPPPIPQPSKLHPFFASKEQKAAAEKERLAQEKESEAAELRQREEKLREKERLILELEKLEQKNKANPPALIFLTPEQRTKLKLEQERDALLESVKKSREETARLSEGKESHPFLLPKAYERAAAERGEDRQSNMLINQIKLPYFPETPHVLQESGFKELPIRETNGHSASCARMRERVRAAAQAEVPCAHGLAVDKCKSLNLIPHFSAMMAIPKETAPKNRQKVRSCTLKNKNITEQMSSLEAEGAKRTPPVDGSQLISAYKAKHLVFCPYENYNTTEENPLWTETYRPQNSGEILGNKDCVTLLHSWLDRWRDKEERRWAKAQDKAKPKLKRLKRDKGDKLCNAMLLVGPHGSGKTATVYAVAKELGFEIIETNASSRRTGKQLTELFGEAIKSHQLQKTVAGGDDEGASATRASFTHSLILVEEVDVQHEDDKGFISTLTQLSTTTKRPFVFVCNEITPALKQLREATGLCTINFTVPQAPLITYPLRVISATEGALTEEDDVASMITWVGCDLRKSILNLQFWTQGVQLNKEKLDSLKLPTMPFYNKWLGFGEFERKYGENLWALLENSATARPKVPDLASPNKGTRKKRGSTGKGKRGKEEPEPATSKNSNAPYDSFWDDQERFLSHSLSLGLDFVFLHYPALLSSPYFSDELFTPIANKANQHTCTIENNATIQPTTTDQNTSDQTTTTANTQTTSDDVVQIDTKSEVTSDNSNDSTALASSQDSQRVPSTPTSQSSQPSQQPQLPQPPQQPPPRVVYVEKDSEEFRMSQIGCDALDAMACVADTLSLRDLLVSRNVRLDLTEYIDEKEDERVKDKLEVIVTCPSYRSDWPLIPFDEALTTSLSALSLHCIHSSQSHVCDQLASHNLPLPSTNLSRTFADLSQTTNDFSRTTSDLSRTTSDLSRTTSNLSRTSSDLSTPASSQPPSQSTPLVTSPNDLARLRPTLRITRCDGLLLHAREEEQLGRVLDGLILPLSVLASVGRESMSTEFLPCLRTIYFYEDIRKKFNPKRGDRFKHHMGHVDPEYQQRVQDFSLKSQCM